VADISQAEMRDILTEIARNATNAAARIAAIKELRALEEANGDAPVESDEQATVAALDELAPRRYRSKRAS